MLFAAPQKRHVFCMRKERYGCVVRVAVDAVVAMPNRYERVIFLQGIALDWSSRWYDVKVKVEVTDNSSLICFVIDLLHTFHLSCKRLLNGNFPQIFKDFIFFVTTNPTYF